MGHAQSGEILLIAKIRVGDDEEIEPGLHGSGQQGSVLGSFPTFALGCADLVAGQGGPQLDRHAFVQKDLHAAS